MFLCFTQFGDSSDCLNVDKLCDPAPLSNHLSKFRRQFCVRRRRYLVNQRLIIYMHILLFGVLVNSIVFYYMAMSQKDWKQTNSRIWLAKIDLDRLLDRSCCNSCPKKVTNKEYEKIGLFLLIILHGRISGSSRGSR